MLRLHSHTEQHWVKLILSAFWFRFSIAHEHYLPGYIAGFCCKVIGRRGWCLWRELRFAYVCTARHADQWRIALFVNTSSCAYSAEHRSLLHCKRSFFCFLRMRQLEQLSALLRRVFRLGGVLLSLNLCMFIQPAKLHICEFYVIRVSITPFWRSSAYAL